MFRKPRTAADSNGEVLGRPPTPPGTPSKKPPAVPPPKIMATKAKTKKQTPLPTIGRQGPSGSAKKTTPKSKLVGKGNSSILSFFKKSEGNEEAEAGLFVQDFTSRNVPGEVVDTDEVVQQEQDIWDDGGEARFNESGSSVKRRRTSVGSGDGQSEQTPAVESILPAPSVNGTARKAGPFFEESDSEQEEEAPEAVIGIGQGPEEAMIAGEMPQQSAVNADATLEPDPAPPPLERTASIPALLKEETSYEPAMCEFGDFEDGDFDEDPFEEGDEFMERKYMEEQARFEMEDDEKDYDIPMDEDDDANNEHDPETAAAVNDSNGIESTCPICSVGLSGVSEHDAGVHVNNCLDGNPTPLPEKKQPAQPVSTTQKRQPASANRFRRPARQPKEGQANPFTLGQPSTSGGSAFTKLMSGHAEDAAWAEAAAAEHASRGKPAYTRTCPFYKILPGLFICVDAFRYGAVKGCNAYFLSHFHSDHYVGLSASWTHGPIYCSKVTANLVKQQLRVDPKYVVALDWEAPFEIPGTKGVMVTMISANHCPGSSLYLFEKVIGKKSNGEPRQQRILHCGDFRACRMHVQHPLLMPEVRDKVTGKNKEQKLDVCYLDTTYLNPKYAFPEQEAVINACAEMCVCLSKDTPDESDGWEQMKRQKAGKGMAKFLWKESHPDVKDEPANDEEPDNMKIEKNPHASQQILSSTNDKKTRGRLLVVVGTYSIGKERVCLGIAKALNSKIYAPPSKQRIIAALEDPELDERMTNDPRAAQVHMTPLFEIRAETLDDYLKDFFPHFTRAVGFRPSGWNYRPPNSRFTESPLVQTVLHSDNWKSTYSMRELVPQRGSTSRASCFGVPYSEHSSFRELTMFCCALRIDKIIPTVNIGSAKSRDMMKSWCERWAAERKKNGLYQLPADGSW